MHYLRFAAALALCTGTLLAQSEADAILKAVKEIPSAPASVSHKALASTPASATLPVFQNVLTVLGDNVENPGVPCFECVAGAIGSNIGLVQPDTNVHADGVTSYAFDNYAVDNSFTGNCNYTFLVRDSSMKYVVKLGPVSIPVSPGPSLTSTAWTIPTSAAVGTGSAITVIQCGSTSAISAMPLFINNP